MRKLMTGAGLLILLLSLGLAAPRWAQAAKPVPPPAPPPDPAPAYCDNCNPDATPPFLGYNQDPPMVMINSSTDHQLFFKAYNDYGDIDGDGLADTTYKDSITYYGYFDSAKCYDYSVANGRFEPKAATDPSAAAPAPPSHYCTGGNDAYWSGNFLNWISMSRIDVIRKVLFGGHRRIDTATSTVLERTYLPHDAHSWAKYYAGDDLDKITPFSEAAGDYTLTSGTLAENGLTFANTTDTDGTGYSQTNTDPPLIKVAKGNYSLWAGNERWQCTWGSGAPRDNHAASNSNVAATSGINSYTGSPAYSKGVVPKNYIARVQACVSGLIGDEKCKLYPGPDGLSGTNDDNYKPIGLLQVYGDQDQMYFGMISGTYLKHVSGGDLVRNVGSMKDEINVATDGTFSQVAKFASDSTPLGVNDQGYGLINAWSLYRVVGYSQSNGTYGNGNPGDGCTWGLSKFSDISGTVCTNWGNPFSEIFYQSINYFSGNGVIGDYRSNASNVIPGLPVPQPFQAPLSDKNYCSRLNVINFNSSVSSYDADELDGNSYKPATIWDSADLPGDKSSKAMTDVVGTGEGINGNSFFVGQVPADNNQLCTPKTVPFLGDVLGLCPDAPRLSGSYRIAGLAYYAHTKDIRPATDVPRKLPEAQLVNAYSVAMATSVPAIEIPDPLNLGVTAVTILPACRNTTLIPQGNCAIVDLKIVSQVKNNGAGVGTGKYYVNWEDSEQGGDYDQDMWGILEYTIAAGKITITTSVIAESTMYKMGFGYVINGTTQDGFHAHSGIEGYTYDDPATITAGADCVAGCQVANAPSTAEYSLGAASASLLKDPLWYASKWGGFKDTDNSGTPNLTKEWDREHNDDGTYGPDGIPDNYFYASNSGQIEPALNRTLMNILKSMASGSAASVISSSRSGEGALYQAIFWPGKGDDEFGTLVRWTGEVHALFVDSQGLPHEDTNGNRQLDATDKEVAVYYDPVAEATMACYGSLDANGQCTSPAAPIEDVKFLWSAADSLNKIPDGNITSNRSDINVPGDANYISATQKRNIFTWNDLDKDGIVTPGEVLPFEENKVTAFQDFGEADQAAMDKLVNWIRGQDQPSMRDRQVWSDLNNNGDDEANEWSTWRLGDVINSTPMLVSRPAENYHFLYKDKTYAEFLEHYQDRRHVIYFGGNDGMLHAVNGGFYRENLKKFCLAAKVAGSDACVENVLTDPALGAELWAYVPYNLAPHLKCLTDPNYCHKYYVDQRPRIFDVRIFTPDTDHPQGWGTVLVGGMRFGGTPVYAATDLSLGNSDKRIFSSSYFIFDITNPEKPPILLGEMTHLNGADVSGMTDAPMGYTTGIPTMVPMNTVAPTTDTPPNPPVNNSSWYLIFGNGPNDLKGNSTLKPTVFVMPMNWLTSSPHELRFPAYTLTAENQRLGDVNGEKDYGAFSLPATALCTNGRNGFVSDPITVDYELLADYKANVVYMGTVEQTAVGSPWYGEMYRLVTEERSYPVPSMNITQNFLTPKDWKVNLLIDVQRPITAAAAVGWDNTNYWVYFGTGRFFNSTIDTPDQTQQSYFGIKEPMVPVFHAQAGVTPAYCERKFSWATVEKTQATATLVDHNATPGQAGLVNVSSSVVQYNKTIPETTVTCPGCPSDLVTLLNDPATDDFTVMTNYIAGTSYTGCEKKTAGGTEDYGTDGWYRNFQVQTTEPIFAERNLGQATLLGGLLTFTTYSPMDQECQRLGNSTLYGLYYQTGTAWRTPVFGDSGLWVNNEVAYKIDLDYGLAITPNLHVGGEEGSTAFVQTSTGAIVAIKQPNLPTQEGKTGRKSWFEGVPTTPAP